MTHPTSSGRDDDAQRRLEQHALRNVRGLVDKIEAGEELNRRAIRKSVAAVALVLAVIAAIGAIYFMMSKPPPYTGPTQIVVPAQKVAPAGPPVKP